MKPTLMFRYERRLQRVSTAPSDIMQVTIGKSYPMKTVYELVLQQLWSEDYAHEEWRDVPIVDKEKPQRPHQIGK